MFKKSKSSKVVATLMAAVIGLSVAGTSISCEAASRHHNPPKVVHHHPAPPAHRHVSHHRHDNHRVIVHHETRHDRNDSGDTIGALILGGIIGAVIANS